MQVVGPGPRNLPSVCNIEEIIPNGGAIKKEQPTQGCSQLCTSTVGRRLFLVFPDKIKTFCTMLAAAAVEEEVFLNLQSQFLCIICRCIYLVSLIAFSAYLRKRTHLFQLKHCFSFPSHIKIRLISQSGLVLVPL